MRDIIVSVGTSLLTNRETETGRPWSGWICGRPLPSSDTAVEYLSRADSVLASAETNTLENLDLHSSDCLHWLHSETPEGRFCAEALRDHYEALGNRGDLHELTGLHYREETFVDLGLRSLVSTAFGIIRKAGTSQVEICATGGFKAELAYLNLVGLLSGCPVHYIHERFRTLITLPALPTAWNTSLVERNIAFFEWMEDTAEGRAAVEVENRLSAVPELRMLVTFADGCGYLSPAGLALYQAYQERLGIPTVTWPPSSRKTPQEKISLESTGHHRPKGWEQFVDWLASIDCISLIKYDGGSDRPSGTKAEVRDPNSGVLKVVYSADFEIHFEVATTARSDDQCRLVADYITRNGKRR